MGIFSRLIDITDVKITFQAAQEIGDFRIVGMLILGLAVRNRVCEFFVSMLRTSRNINNFSSYSVIYTFSSK